MTGKRDDSGFHSHTILRNRVFFIPPSTSFVHCDPHPGNVLVHREMDGQLKIVLLDHGLYQTLTDDFRIDYCNLWLALINGDVEEIKTLSARLGAADMYGLLACMVAGRSWDSIQGGVGTSTKSEAEMNEIADYAGKLVVDISRLLNKVGIFVQLTDQIDKAVPANDNSNLLF